MAEKEEVEKTCPILAASANSGSSTSTGSYWASRCKRDGCGWWDDQRKCCALVAISQGLGELMSAGFLARAS